MPGEAGAEERDDAARRAEKACIARRSEKRAYASRDAGADPDGEHPQADEAELGADLQEVVVRVLEAVGPRELGR